MLAPLVITDDAWIALEAFWVGVLDQLPHPSASGPAAGRC
jgi:hypothetical protein